MLFVIALAVTIHVATIKTRNPGEILEHSRLSGKESSQLASRNNPRSSPKGV
jgi:hypothetical protein